MKLQRPDDIVKEITGKREARKTIGAQQNFHTDLFGGLKMAMAQMVASAVKLIRNYTYTVKVENQIKLPELQKVKDITTPDVVEAISKLAKHFADLRETNDKNTLKLAKELSTALKPKETDLSPVVKAVQGIKIPETKFPDPVREIQVTNLDELKKPLAELASKLKIEFPTIDIPEFPKSITVGNLEGIESILASLVSQTEQLANKEVPQTDLKPLIDATKAVQRSIDELVFPIPTFTIPKTVGGNVPVEVTAGDETARYDVQGDTIYEGVAPRGTAEGTAIWTVIKYDLADLTAASGKIAKDITWTGRAGASYG